LLAGTVLSTWQAIRATRAESAAHAQARKAMAINEFLTDDLLKVGVMWAHVSSRSHNQPITLQEVLDRAAEKVGSRFNSQPLLEAVMHTTIAATYYHLELWKASQRHSAAALVIYEREKGPWAAERAKAMILYAGSLLQLNEHEGDFSKAESITREVLKFLRQIEGEDHPNTLSAMWVLADAYGKQRKFHDEHRTYTELLEAGRRIYGDEDAHTIAWMYWLALSSLNLGDLSQAERLAVKALELSRRVLGQDHPETLGCLNIASKVYQAQGRLSDTERVTREIVAYWQTQVAKAPENPYPLNRVAWLLATCPEIRDPKRAVELARKAVDRAPNESNFWNTLGVALYRAGDWKGAIDALDESETLAPDKYLHSNGFFLAMAEWQLGHKDEARAWYERTIAGMDKRGLKDNGPQSPRAEADELMKEEPAIELVRP
jgi:tetratricopeptide (TPR) repeat protein